MSVAPRAGDPVQVVILAGGLGTRLWPLTRDVPKPLVPVAGRPYLEYQLDLLRRQQIRDVLLLTGHLGQRIADHFGDGSRLGLNIRYSCEEQPLGTGGALRLARPLLEETFVLLNGDSYLPIEYRSVLAALRQSNVLAVLAVYDNRREDTRVKNNILLDAERRVARYQKGAPEPAGLTHVDAGVLALRRDALDLYPNPGSFSLENDLYPLLIDRRTMLGVETAQRFYDIGTPEGLRMFESAVAS